MFIKHRFPPHAASFWNFCGTQVNCSFYPHQEVWGLVETRGCRVRVLHASRIQSSSISTTLHCSLERPLEAAVDYKELPPTSLLNEKDIQLFVQALKITCFSVYDVITLPAGHHLSVCSKSIFLWCDNSVVWWRHKESFRFRKRSWLGFKWVLHSGCCL